MQIRVKTDTVEISGYVNAVERRSKPLKSRIGQFMERICKGAFKRAIAQNSPNKASTERETRNSRCSSWI